jgi:hypothetical protein
MMVGRKILGVFSSPEKAQEYTDHVVSKVGLCQIESSFVRGYYQAPNYVFAAHSYDRREDVHVLEGLYSELSQAQRAAGREGEIIEFSIDSPEEKRITMNQ